VKHATHSSHLAEIPTIQRLIEMLLIVVTLLATTASCCLETRSITNSTIETNNEKKNCLSFVLPCLGTDATTNSRGEIVSFWMKSLFVKKIYCS
jgi:hypothetical protein